MRKIAFSLILALGLFNNIDLLAQESSSTISVRNFMSAEDFQKTGLNKLTSDELAALDAWFVEVAIKIMEFNSSPESPRTSASSVNFSTLDGATIVADDGQFLGVITKNRVASNSILNSVGSYGSRVSSTSIFNQVGQYGGRVSRLSPFNRAASSPPRIYKGNEFIAYLTINTTKQPRIDPNALIGWLQSN